jgi:hypothetical protein
MPEFHALYLDFETWFLEGIVSKSRSYIQCFCCMVLLKSAYTEGNDYVLRNAELILFTHVCIGTVHCDLVILLAMKGQS